MPTAALPLPDPEPDHQGAGPNGAKGDYALPPAALLDAPKTIRKIDERELMDGGAPARREMPRVLRRSSVAQIHPGPVVTTSNSSRTPA